MRTIGLGQMVFYSAGSMLGAGIYGLIGKAAGELGSAVWLGFLLAMVAALLTGLSYASLGSRYPRAGGAAYVTHRAYGRGLLTHVLGLAVAGSGLTSIAAGSWVIGLNLQRIPFLSETPVVVLTVAYLFLMAGIVFRGIRESMWANVVCSVVEAAGLALIIVVGAKYWGSVDMFQTPATPSGGSLLAIPPLLMVQGAVLTFFSFVGFEDTLNVAEEVKNPRRTLPLGLVLGMSLACVLYIGVAVTAVSVIPWRELADAKAPLADVMARAAPWFPDWAFVVITVFAVANSALINYVTASRLLYGMARDGRLPAQLARVHPTRRTPHFAIVILLVLLIALAMAGDIAELASATVLLLLCVFVVVNASLVVLTLRKDEPKGGFEIPVVIPAAGAVVCLGLLVARIASDDWRAPLIAGVLLASAAALYPFVRSRPTAPTG
ncbi:MAG: amino acid permease [Phenylobacterium sp.]|uniref:APC family permease n=1 Tax=Phenylobacterium sp. TaxID=1871053 RepID=UPI00271D61B9|nr:amino acid permease [Phenylobacterium sp.]MDO8913023.1 amino acid permease [Phenylobacterium sp.]